VEEQEEILNSADFVAIKGKNLRRILNEYFMVSKKILHHC